MVQAATLDPTGTRVAIAAGKQAVVWNIQTNERTAVLEHDEIVISCSFRADGKRLATASVDNIAKIWDLPDGNLQHTLEHTFPEIRMAEFVGTSNNYATVTTNETITESRLVIWDSDTGATLQDSLYPDRIVGMAFNDDGTRAATSSVDRRVAVWDISTGQPIGPGMAHGAPVTQMFFVADDRQLVTVAKQGTIARWRVETGSQFGDETRLDGAVVHAHISSDDTFIAIAGADGRVQIRWLDSGELVCGQLIHSSTASTIAFHPNNRVFVCSGNDGALKQWDLAGVDRSALRLQHDAEVLQAQF